MKVLMGPGLALMNALTTPQKMLATAAVFSLSIWIAGYLLVGTLGVAWQDPALLLIGGAYLLAVYSTLGHHLQVKTGFGGLRESIERFSRGDLEHRSEGTSQGEIGILLRQIRDMSASLAGIFERVRGSADAINQAAKEIAAGHVNLSQRTEEQASTLEQTASGMEQLSGTVKQNAESCQRASDLSRSADEVAQRGAQTVRRVVERMATISGSSNKMAEIIGVIEGIAFQTNILALNAAVEAARAGEQGRGFAVVASEVRALAQRSADAAKEIKALIEQSVGQISSGSKQATGAGKVIDQIVVSVQQVSQLIGEIAVASAQQSAGVGEINKAILQLESVTQQNAALVEEASANSLTFQDQAERLRALVARFKTTAAAAAPAPQRSAPSARARPRPASRPLAR